MTSASTVIAAGVLRAVGELASDLDVDRATEVLQTILVDGAIWTPGIRRESADSQIPVDPRVRAGGRPSRWENPGVISAELEAILEPAWHRAFNAVEDETRPQLGRSALRLSVSDLTSRTELVELGRDMGDVVLAPLIRRRSRRFRWSWPLRLYVEAGSGAADLLRDGQLIEDRYRNLLIERVVPRDELADADIVLTTASDLEALPAASILVVVDDRGRDIKDIARLLATRDDGQQIVSARRDVAWLGRMVEELAHDYTLDAAVAVAADEVIVIGDPDTIGMTSIRAHTDWMTDQLSDDEFEPSVRRLESALNDDYGFEQERLAAREVAEVSVHVADAFGAAQPSMVRNIEAPSAGEALAPPPAEILDAATPLPDAEALAPDGPPDTDQHLHIRLRRPDGITAVDPEAGSAHFRSGEQLYAAVRIARLGGDGLPALDSFPGEEVRSETLTVVIRLQAHDGPIQFVTELPFTNGEDSDWTADVGFVCPALGLRIYVTVLDAGQPVQTAIFHSKVDIENAAAAFEVDSEPLPEAIIGQLRHAAIASYPGLDGSIVIPLVSGADTEGEHVDDAISEIKSRLRAAWAAMPGDLERQVEIIRDLARLGAALHERIGGREYDEVDHLHLVEYAHADLPLELAYSHAKPDPDVTQLCDRFQQGPCEENCPNKVRHDLVCPNGFWAFDKVIERRSHIADRRRHQPAGRRIISMSKGVAPVAVSSLFDNEDDQASTATRDALATVAGDAVLLADWQAVESAVAENQPGLIVFCPHREEDRDETILDREQLEIAGHRRALSDIDERIVQVGKAEPGPIVLAIGCQTTDAAAPFLKMVEKFHHAGAEVVITALSDVPGSQVSMFIQELCEKMAADPKSAEGAALGPIMLAARRSLLEKGSLIALAMVMSGDGRVLVKL